MTPEEQEAYHEGIYAALQAAVSDALEEHKRAGRKIPIWRDGKVVWLFVDDARKVKSVSDVEAPGG